MSKTCARCNGEGFIYRLPNGRNPFKMTIFQIAQSARRIPCPDCVIEAKIKLAREPKP